MQGEQSRAESLGNYTAVDAAGASNLTLSCGSLLQACDDVLK